MFGLSNIASAVVVVAVLGSLAAVARNVYLQGEKDQKLAQQKVNEKTYIKIMKGIADGKVNVDNPVAVDCVLRELAGVESEGTECSDL